MKFSKAGIKVLAFKASRELRKRATTLLHWMAYHVLPFRSKLKPGDKTRVVFVGDLLQARIVRMAKWLSRTGQYEVIMVIWKPGFSNEFFSEEAGRAILVENDWHLRSVLRSIQGIDLIHGFGPPSHMANVARKHLPMVRFIHDLQDVRGSYFKKEEVKPKERQELSDEKEAMQHCRALVCHSLEPRRGFVAHDIVQRPDTLYFPLYCDDDAFQKPAEGKNLDGEIHFAYAGGVAGSHRPKRLYGIIQFHSFIETLTEQKLHFHIYPSPTNIRADYEEYERMSVDNPYFHFHDPIPQSVLSKELSQYHFGVLPFFHGDSGLSEYKFRYATTLKLFNYIEAALPIVVSRDLTYQSWMVARHRAGIVVDKSDLQRLREIVRLKPYHEQVQDLLHNRSRLALSGKIGSLVSLYEKVLKGNRIGPFARFND
jgi:hypothetical protein